MFKVGELVAYAASGIYEIVDVREEAVLGAVCSYYVLRAFEDKTGSLSFVPTENGTLTSAMRYLMSAEEANRLISSFSDIEPAVWTANSKERSEAFKTAMISGDYATVIALMKSVWEKGKERESIGKKIYQTDHTLLRKAEGLLYTEMAIALGTTASEISDTVRNLGK